MVILLTVLVASCFNKAVIGRMLGIFTMCEAFGVLVGTSFMGYSFDITGGYNLALLIIISLFIVSLPLVFLASPQAVAAN